MIRVHNITWESVGTKTQVSQWVTLFTDKALVLVSKLRLSSWHHLSGSRRRRYYIVIAQTGCSQLVFSCTSDNMPRQSCKTATKLLSSLQQNDPSLHLGIFPLTTCWKIRWESPTASGSMWLLRCTADQPSQNVSPSLQTAPLGSVNLKTLSGAEMAE